MTLFYFEAGRRSTHLVLAVWLAVMRGANGEDDDHDQQSATGCQDGYQGFTVCWFLGLKKTEYYF